MSSLKLQADSSGGTVELKGPATTASNAAKTWILPNDTGTANQYLKHTSTAGTLEFASLTASSLGDDYEEGTWTPTGDGTGFSATSCSYTKIGRLVHISGTLTVASNSSSTLFKLQSFPFAVASSTIIPLMAGGEGSKAMFWSCGAGSEGILRDTGFTSYAYSGLSGDYISFSGCYFTS